MNMVIIDIVVAIITAGALVTIDAMLIRHIQRQRQRHQEDQHDHH